MKRALFAVGLVFLTHSSALFAKDYIVLFKQSEVAVSSLDHSGFKNLLQSANQKNVSQLQDWLGTRGMKGIPVQSLWLVRGAVTDMDDTTASRLAHEPWVKGVYVDKFRQFVTPSPNLTVANSLKDLGEDPTNMWGLNRIHLAQLRAAFPKIDGTGVRVGVLDTGIQSKHPELPAGTRFKDFVNNLPNAYDDHGHGTHVSGTISGKQVGIAPGVQLTMGKILNASGAGYDSTILAAMQWIYDPDGTGTNYPQVVSNSWGADLSDALSQNVDDFAPYQIAIQTWILGGIVPVFAAGNSGKSPNGMPGGLPEPISVGALDVNDSIAEFSSRGPNVWRIGGSLLTFLKPDVSAPGVKITSSFPGNKYATWDGTSMATPHVTGTVALILQANPKLTYADVKEILMKSSDRKTDVSFGYGAINAYEAVKLATSR